MKEHVWAPDYHSVKDIIGICETCLGLFDKRETSCSGVTGIYPGGIPNEFATEDRFLSLTGRLPGNSAFVVKRLY